MMEAAQLLDLGDYPEIHAAGIGECYLLPDGRMRSLMFDWLRMDGVWRRRIVGAVIRPVANLREDQSMMWREAVPNYPALLLQ